MYRRAGFILDFRTNVGIPPSFELCSTRVSTGGKSTMSIVIGWFLVADLKSDAM